MNVIPLLIWIPIGSIVGFYLCKSYKKRVEILAETEKLISEIIENIKHFKRPIVELLETFKFKTQLKDVISNEEIKCDYLQIEEIQELKNLINEIAICETNIALTKLDIYKFKISTSLSEAKEELSKKGVTYQKLGILFGLLVGVIFM